MVDPSYANTELFTNYSTGNSGPLSQIPSTSHVSDYRNGNQIDIWNNPGKDLFSAKNLASVSVLNNTTYQSTPTGTGQITAATAGFDQFTYCSAPGYNLGNHAFGPNGWSTCVA